MTPSTLQPASRKLVLVIHVASAAGTLGADLTILALGTAGVLQPELQPLAPAAALIAVYVVQPLALTTLVSGLMLIWIGGYGLVRHWWVTAKLAIVLALATALTFFLVPSLNRLATLDASAGRDPRETVAMVISPAGASALLLIAVTLGVFKPGSRRTAAVSAAARS